MIKAVLFSVVDVAPVAYLDNDYFKLFVLDSAKDPVIPHAIPPKAGKVADKGLSPCPRVGQFRYFVHVVDNALSYRFVKFRELSDGLFLIDNFQRPNSLRASSAVYVFPPLASCSFHASAAAS